MIEIFVIGMRIVVIAICILYSIGYTALKFDAIRNYVIDEWFEDEKDNKHIVRIFVGLCIVIFTAVIIGFVCVIGLIATRTVKTT